MQINLTGFLTSKTPEFMSALWKLLLEAQESPAGMPKTFIEEKKEEMRLAREKDSRALGERDRRARLDEIREKERDERGNRGGGRGRGRGRGRGGWDDDRGGRMRDGGWGGRGGGVRLAMLSTRASLTKALASSRPPEKPFSAPLRQVSFSSASIYITDTPF